MSSEENIKTVSDIEIQGCKTEGDIHYFLGVYGPDELVSEVELNEGLTLALQHCQAYRHLHTELKLALGEEYDLRYPKFEETLGKLTEYIKTVKQKLREFREENEIKEKSFRWDEKLRLEREKSMLKENEKMVSMGAKFHAFVKRLKRKIDSFDENDSDITDMKQNIDKIDHLLDDFYAFDEEIKGVVGEQYEAEFSDDFVATSEKAEEVLKRGKLRIAQLLHDQTEKAREENLARSNLESERTRKEDEKIRKERDFIASTLYEEVKTRCNNLIGQCMVDVFELDDYQILELKKNMIMFMNERSLILEKITSFSKYQLDREIHMNELCDLKDETMKTVSEFTNELQGVMKSRDLSEEKLKRAFDLKIDLPKFKGYDSVLDIYTFRAEFEKLIEPVVQRKLWPDYLKRNYLTGPAVTLVDKIESIDDIWKKLFASFGNTRLLLENKISGLDNVGSLWRMTGDEKIGLALNTLVNTIHDLSSLAQTFEIENELYYGGCLEKILSLLGNKREREFICKGGNSNTSKPAEWQRLVIFLKDEISQREKMALFLKSKKALIADLKEDNPHFKKNEKPVKSVHQQQFAQTKNCHICKESGHVITKNRDEQDVIQYYACKKFVEMSPEERKKALYERKLCAGCLEPGVRFNSKHDCPKTYLCPNDSHKKFSRGWHVLVCMRHRENVENQNLLKKFKSEVIGKGDFENFTKNINTSYYSGLYGNNMQLSKEDVPDDTIFLFQTIKVGDMPLNLFFDSGCGDMVIRKDAVDTLQQQGRATLLSPGPITFTGVGDNRSVSEHGTYTVRLPLLNGNDATMSGLCLDKVTADFPKYPLQKVAKDMEAMGKSEGANWKGLPTLPSQVGGRTDVIIGLKYKKYFPKEFYMFKSGLTVYSSHFKGIDGTVGTIGGPHHEFSRAAKRHFKGTHASYRFAYYIPPVNLYWQNFQLACKVPLLGSKIGSVCDSHIIECNMDNKYGTFVSTNKPLKCIKEFDQVENAGTEISYRCVNCRNCPECKKCPRLDSITIQEEVEQSIIDRSVHVDTNGRVTTAALPFVVNPDLRLEPNEHLALKIYKSQVRKLENRPTDKMAVIQSENKLQKMGFVDFVDNLSKKEQDLISGKLQYFIPWRTVWNEKSVSTPCRLVFDASHCTKTGVSLNSLLAKGVNSMNKLVEILIRWTTHKFAFHTDIQKMYNAVQLQSSHWRYQMYLWRDDLDVERPPRQKVIKTLIYGVRSSGNLAERGLRQTAELTKSEFPRACEIITNDLYVDDCLSGEDSFDELLKSTDALDLVLGKGGFTLKGITYSGSDPPDHLTETEDSVIVGGLKWFPKGDFISINCGEINFSRKERGRKSGSQKGIIPKNLTKRDCAGKVAEVFDSLGRVTPIIGGMKLDLHELNTRKLDWDDKIPEDLYRVWVENFGLISQISEIRFNRTIVPENAINLNIETIDTADASSQMICVAIYARFKLKSGGFSCQLIFAKSKLVPKNMSTPRAELLAATLNATCGHVVKVSLGELHTGCLKLTDSQVALFWIGCTRSALKMWVRNRVIEINRLAEADLWRYVDSRNMVADIGTRKGVRICDVLPQSEWILGKDWMSGPMEDFPVKTAQELVLSSAEVQNARKECIMLDDNSCFVGLCSVEGLSRNDDTESHVGVDLECEIDELYIAHTSRYTLADKHTSNNTKSADAHALARVHVATNSTERIYKDRYQFSNFLLDPLKFRFRKIVRILGLVFLFISKLKRVSKINEKPLPSIFQSKGDRYIITTGSKTFCDPLKCAGGLVVSLPDSMISSALHYYLHKASNEVKQFVDKTSYNKISTGKDDVLYYTGRILSTQSIEGRPSLSDVSLDLTATTFCVPISDGQSPVARAIVDEIHWYHPDVKHAGIESELRQVQVVSYVIGGRQLVKRVKRECKKCRILEKNAIKVAMGPIKDVNLCISPAFYSSQVDICGPFNAYSFVNKRAMLKIWFTIFCCCTTGAVDCKVMEDYSTDSFLLAFIRFSCRFGYPKRLLPDAGSQLVKGCENMVISYSSLQNQLSTEYGVDYEICPIGAHYMHGKVERKIQQIKKSITKEIENNRLSVMQWETLGIQIANSINNLPIGLGNKIQDIENLDILTPNRLILGRNNNRAPTVPLELTGDCKRIIETNAKIFGAWFSSWLVSYVPTLIDRPKWFKNDTDISVDDVIMFLKEEKEFNRQYQYGIVRDVKRGRDNRIRTVEIEYQNHNENVKRKTIRGARDVVVIHRLSESHVHDSLPGDDKIPCGTCLFMVFQ